MSDKIFALFPGQGSQKTGMGKELFDSFETANKIFSIADAKLNFSLSSLCFNGPNEELTKTEISQPAILTVSTICYEIAKSKSDFKIPTIAAGHSLGEYSALVAGGALSFEDAVLLVHKRGQFMQEAVPSGEGKMLAVLGKELEDIENIISNITNTVEVANINSPGQIVLSGSAIGIDSAKELLSDTKTIELNVSAPFHSSLMKPAADKLAIEIDKVNFKTPDFPIVCNFTGLPTTNPDEIRQNLKDQVCGRVRWVECFNNGIREYSPSAGIEYGFGRVIAGLGRKIDKTFKISNYYPVE